MPSETGITVLVSVGRHPVTGRYRRADQDARAVEMALGLSLNSNISSLEVLHAGDASEASLREYLGMGIGRLEVISQSPYADVVPAIAKHLGRNLPGIVLTGVTAEQGESSGMLPYLLAESLGWPMVNNIAEIEEIKNGEASILQALPRGQRRRVKVKLPFVASVDKAAEPPRQIAYIRSRDGEIVEANAASEQDQKLASWEMVPAKKRPKRLKVVKSKTAADRFKAATAKSEAKGGKVMQDPTPEEAAKAIISLLKEEGVLRR